jgi:putative N-acetyltransferase (TIGR04045 family)
MSFHCRIAGASDRAAYLELRRSIFCDEQGLFAASDQDELDAVAFPIVCLGPGERVVGVVRTWQAGPGQWWGGRLGVHRDFRTVGSIGRWLVQHAVGVARARGARQFRATVQAGNVAFFRRLHWRSLEQLELLGRTHHLMEADLERYAPVAPEASDEAA